MCDLQLLLDSHEEGQSKLFDPLTSDMFGLFKRMISASVLVMDIVEMSNDVSKNEITLHLLFAVVEHFYKGIESIRKGIVKAIVDEKFELPVIQALVEDGEYEEDETVLPVEIDSFHDLIRGVLQHVALPLLRRQPDPRYSS